MKEFNTFEVVLIMIAVILVTLYTVKVYDFKDYGSRISSIEMDVQHLEEEETGISQ